MVLKFAGYMPEELIREDERALRREYTKLRDIGRKRLQRLRASEFSESETARYWGEEIPKLKDLKTKEEIAFALSELEGFISSPYSTVSGTRKAQKEKLDKALEMTPKLRNVLEKLESRHDLKLTKSTAQSFFDFMDSKIAQDVTRLYGSDRVLTMYKILKKKGIRNFDAYQRTIEDFIFFLKNLENLEAVEVRKGEKKSVSKYKQLIENEIHHGKDRSLYFKSKTNDISLDDLKPKRSYKRQKK